MSTEIQNEPLLDENWERWVSFPIQHHDAWEWYKKLENEFYSSSYVTLSNDEENFKLQDAKVRVMLPKLLEDQLILDKVHRRFVTEGFLFTTQLPEVRSYLSFQCALETVHCELYSSFLTAWNTSGESIEDRLRATIASGEMCKLRQAFCEKYFSKEESSLSFDHALIGSICTDSIFRSSLVFIALQVDTLTPKMGGFQDFCKHVLKDFKTAAEFACYLHCYKLNKRKIEKTEIEQIVREAVDIELRFASELKLDEIFPPAAKGAAAPIHTFILDVGSQLLNTLDCDQSSFDKENARGLIPQKWEALNGVRSLLLEPQTTSKSIVAPAVEQNKVFSTEEDF